MYGEALHNYLEFTCDDYLKPDGLAIHTYPAIKFSDDRDALQQGLVDGPICTTATDEWTTYKNIKLAGDTIPHPVRRTQRNRDPNAVTYTKLAANGRIDLQRFAAITSTNAAKSWACTRRRAPSPWAATPTSFSSTPTSRRR